MRVTAIYRLPYRLEQCGKGHLATFKKSPVSFFVPMHIPPGQIQGFAGFGVLPGQRSGGIDADDAMFPAESPDFLVGTHQIEFGGV